MHQADENVRPTRTVIMHLARESRRSVDASVECLESLRLELRVAKLRDHIVAVMQDELPPTEQQRANLATLLQASASERGASGD